ncbi:YhcN/YlaJ family sporulation lipoprotein [Robertmurraya massiliosenegalensis]|uniref:YhcN/YlaJ family sporulation lipoprotein n=1 Tax=Robertmurraya TaxID=2837507 RepID=UPI0039A6B65C
MKYKYFAWPATVAIALGLGACGNNDEAVDGQDRQPLAVGYHSNEHHEEDGGNANLVNEDNDGPVTEILDHTIAGEGGNRRLLRINNEAAPDGEYNTTLFSRSDQNYHAHLNTNNSGARSPYYTAYNGRLAQRVAYTATTVVNVADARAVVQEDQIMVGAVLEDPQRSDETKAAIREAVEPHADGKKVTVTTNDSMYSRIRTIDNELRDGGPRDVINDDIDHIFRTISNETNRAVENNQ